MSGLFVYPKCPGAEIKIITAGGPSHTAKRAVDRGLYSGVTEGIKSVEQLYFG
jgi:hypothetical protein